MPRSESPAQILRQMLLGKFVARAVGAAAQLGIADHLSAGPRAICSLSELTGCDPEALYRVMRALAAVGVFSEAEGREFALTPVGHLLCSEVRGSMRNFAQWLGAEPAGWRAWGALDHTLRTGEPGFEASEGEPVFSYLARTPAAGALFDAMMAGAEADAQAVAEACELSWLMTRASKTVVDVGGNHGALLLAILARHPQIRGINFDTPAVIARARAALAASGQSGQLELMAGDFFEWVPGADLYLLRRIVHDWSDPLAVRILRRCRESMAPDGRVLVAERPITTDARGSGTKWMDLEMMVMTRGGRERTMAEYAGLYAQAGLQMTRVTAAAGGLAIIEGTLAPSC